MAVTVTYASPVTGATPPTAAQAANCNSVTGTVIATANGDTTATLTHNFGLSAAALAALQPWVILGQLNVAFYASTWIYVPTDGNTVTLTKSGAAGGAGPAQLQFTILRPHSEIV